MNLEMLWLIGFAGAVLCPHLFREPGWTHDEIAWKARVPPDVVRQPTVPDATSKRRPKPPPNVLSIFNRGAGKPWPMARDELKQKAADRRTLIVDKVAEHCSLGRRLAEADDDSTEKRRAIDDLTYPKSSATLQMRAGSIGLYSAWISPFEEHEPITTEKAYKYVPMLVQEMTPPTRGRVSSRL